jgi:hypothetical protein
MTAKTKKPRSPKPVAASIVESDADARAEAHDEIAYHANFVVDRTSPSIMESGSNCLGRAVIRQIEEALASTVTTSPKIPLELGGAGALQVSSCFPDERWVDVSRTNAPRRERSSPRKSGGRNI